MRQMDENEIRNFISDWKWGTIISTDGNKPYGVEVTYGFDGKHIYCGSRPGSRTALNIKGNQNIAFKICDANKNYPQWRAVIIEGEAKRLTNREEIFYGVRLIAKANGKPEDAYYDVAEMMASNPEESNALKIPIKLIGGMTAK